MCKDFFTTARLALLLTASFGARPAQGAAPGNQGPPRVDRHGDPLPAGAIARLGTIRWRQPLRDGSGFARVSFSPDGKVLISTGDCGLCLWDVATGKQMSWSPDAARIRAAVFSPDGKRLITQADRPRENQSGDPFQVNCLIEHWEVGTGKRLHKAEFKLSREFTTSFPVFSADGKFFVQNGRENKLHVGDTQTGKHLLQLDQDVSYWNPISLSTDNRLLAVIGRYGHLRLYDRAAGKELRRIYWKEGPSYTGYYAPALSPNGKLLVASTPSTLRVWDTATGELKREFKDCRGVATFSADGKYLACGDRKGIRLWEIASLREVRRFEEPHSNIRGLAFSADARLVASAQEHTVGIWDVATGKHLNGLPAHNGVVYSLTFTPSGTGLVSGADDGVAIVWNLATAQPRHRLPGHYLAATSLACSPDGKLLATGDGQPYYGLDDREAQIRLWRLGDGTLVRQFTAHLHSVNCLAFSPDGKRIVSGGFDARFRVWDPATGKRLYQVRGSDGIRSLAFSPEGKTLVLGNTDGELGLWKADTGQKLRDLGLQGQTRRYVVYTSFLRDGKTVVSEEHGDDRKALPKLRFWDAESGREIRSIAIKGSYPFYANAPSGHNVSADGTIAATVASDHRVPAIQLWDLSSGKMLALLRGHAGSVNVLAFSPDGKLLASGSRDTTVLIWDVEKARMQHYWSELLSGTTDAKNIQAMAAEPARAVTFLKERLTRSVTLEARARRLIADLDDDQFAVREKAARELERLGPGVEPILRLAAKENPSLEVRRRIQDILAGLKKADKLEVLDPVRVRVAVTILEKIDTPESRRTIEELARGPAEACVTRESRAALERMKKPAKGH
jgi:WD40 repeat protein